MNSMLSRICGMLKSPRADQQIAAAMVLGVLSPRDAGVVKALGGALTTGGRPVRIAALGALGEIGSAAVLPQLLPLIDSNDEETREAAVQTLAAIGSSAIKPIASQIIDATPASRRALITILARVKTADSIRALISLIKSGHPDAAREGSQALVTLSTQMTRTEKSRIKTNLEKILRTHPDKAPEGALSAALLTMSAVGPPGTAPLLLRLTSVKYPVTVRRDALLAIAGVLKGRVMPQKILDGIFPILQDGPSPALRSAALEVLVVVDLPATAIPLLLQLLENNDPAVRRFAARKLGGKGLGGVKVARKLIPLLNGHDPSLRDAAGESLSRMPEAAAPLTEEILEAGGVHHAWTLAHVMKTHAPKLRKPAVKKVFDEAVRTLTSNDRLWEPLLFVVRHRDPNLMYEWLMKESARFKKARKYAESEACLIPLSRGDHFDSEARYALALAGIRASDSRGSRAMSSQSADLFKQLLRDPEFPLIDRLKKERSHLQAQHLYDLGFSFSEGSPSEKEAGAELLRTVAARSGSSTKLGKSARRKLRLEGLGL